MGDRVLLNTKKLTKKIISENTVELKLPVSIKIYLVIIL